MKLNLLLLSLTLMSVGCVKSSDTKVDVPKLKKMEPITIKKLGQRCDILGTESKEIFIETSIKEGGEMQLTLRDFISDDQVSLDSATIEGFNTLSFTLSETEKDGQELLTGTSSVFKTENAVINSEYKVLTTKATLLLDQHFNGTMTFTHMVKISDTSFGSEDDSNIVSIENCEAFEARTL